MTQPVAELLFGLARLYETEPRPGGKEAAQALTGCAEKLRAQPALPEAPADPFAGFATACAGLLAETFLPIIPLINAALPAIRWVFAGLDDGRIRPEIARRMLTAELIGPDGLVFHPGVRVGLFMQDAGLDYVTRSHAAEECFVMLSGEGFWSTHDLPATACSAGEVIFHPSMTPHRSETRARPLLAAWRWSGDIGWDSYALKDDGQRV